MDGMDKVVYWKCNVCSEKGTTRRHIDDVLLIDARLDDNDSA